MNTLTNLLKTGGSSFVPTFLNTVFTIQTGGNIMNDILIFDDNKVLVITDDCIYYFNSIEALIKKQKKARKYNYMPEIENLLNEFREYINLFKLAGKLIKAEKELLTINVNTLFEGCNFTELRAKKEKQKTDKQIKEAKKWLFHWSGGLHLKYKANKVYLRYNKLNDEIETSKGARVPARESKILFDRIQAGKDIKGYQIGYYTVISLNGVLKIGCHEIERDEIKRIAKLLNW